MKISVINYKVKNLDINRVFLALYLHKIAKFIQVLKINLQIQRLANKINLLKILIQIKEKEVVDRAFQVTNPKIQELMMKKLKLNAIAANQNPLILSKILIKVKNNQLLVKLDFQGKKVQKVIVTELKQIILNQNLKLQMKQRARKK